VSGATRANQTIRDALRCPKCGQRGKIRPSASGAHDPGVSIRLACADCGMLGTFVPPDPVAWSMILPADAVEKIQAFLDNSGLPENAVDLLATMRRKDERVEELEAEIRQIAQMVHQAYHGGRPPDDLCDVTWDKCALGICRRAQHVLGVSDDS